MEMVHLSHQPLASLIAYLDVFCVIGYYIGNYSFQILNFKKIPNLTVNEIDLEVSN